MNGYIYLATNSDFPSNTILIGKSKTDPRFLENISNIKTRIKSQIKYFAHVEDYDLVHFSLDLRFKNLKKSSDNFLFDCSILEAIRNIKELSTILSEVSYFEKTQIYKDHERKKEERANKKAEEERKQQEIAAKKAEEEQNLKIHENKMNNGCDFDKKVETSNTQPIYGERMLNRRAMPTPEQITNVLYGKKQEQVDELIKNKTKKKESSPDEYLSEGGQTIFGYLLVIIIVGAIVVKVFGIGEGSKHPGTYYNNPMHEGR